MFGEANDADDSTSYTGRKLWLISGNLVSKNHPLLVADPKTLSLFHQLDEMGVKLAIDNFGTGHSSLIYLQQFHVDYLKIDQFPLSPVSAPSRFRSISWTT